MKPLSNLSKKKERYNEIFIEFFNFLHTFLKEMCRNTFVSGSTGAFHNICCDSFNLLPKNKNEKLAF